MSDVVLSDGCISDELLQLTPLSTLPRRPRRPERAMGPRKSTVPLPEAGHSLSRPFLASSPGRRIRTTRTAALVIAQRIRTLLHRVVTARILVPTPPTLAADPESVQLAQPAPAQAAVGAGEAPATRAWVAEVDAAVLLVVVRDIVAGVPSPRTFVEGGGRAVDVVYHEFDVTSARVHVMVVKIVVGAHGHRDRARFATEGDRTMNRRRWAR